MNDNREIKPITDNLAADIEKLPLISTFLPYEFGGSTIRDVEVTCASCGTDLHSDTIRGEFETVAEGQSAHMTAYGICFKCKTITPVVSKFHGDGVVLTKVNLGWVQDVWTKEKAGGVMETVKQVLPPMIALFVVVGWFFMKG
jgi:hypothetical protein